MSKKDIVLKLQHITKNYGSLPALKGIDLDIRQGEFLAILGPSGCGKTTLLMIIAGLLPSNSGEIILNGQPINSLPPQKREASLVFQNYALFPHMTVCENMGYGLKVNRMDSATIARRVDEMLRIVDLSGYEDRHINELSGGQQQRVALGRAIITEPSILLFDEPLSNLDEELRTTMRQEILRVQRALKITSLYVTHDQNEALAIADRIVVMKKGELVQIATPETLYYQPQSRYVANFFGHKNIFSCPVKSGSFTLFGQTFPLSDPYRSQENIDVLIRSEEIDLCDPGASAPQGRLSLKGIVTERKLNGNQIRYQVKCEQTQLEILALNRLTDMQYNPGDSVGIVLNPSTFHIMKPERT